MALSLLPLLIHSQDIPPQAREALRTAGAAPEEVRSAALEHAARVLYAETSLECDEVRDMLDLSSGPCA